MMRKIYESPEADVISFEAMEQIALLPERNTRGDVEVGTGPSVSGGVGDRDEW